MCILVKDCILRSTRAGDVVVVIEHVGQSDTVQETLTLLVFDQSAASAANIVSKYYSRVEGHTPAERLAKDNAIRRAKGRTEPLNHAKLRAVHADYRRDLLGEAEAAPQAREEDAALQVTASQIIGRSARISLVFTEDDEEISELCDVAVVAVAGSAVKVALTFSRHGRSERRVMRADRAASLMPPPEVLFAADFVATKTLGYIKCLPKSKGAVEQMVSAEEVVRLVEGLGFRCPQRNVPFALANVQARAVRAAFTLDDAILRATSNRVELPQVPVDTLSVESMVALLAPLRDQAMYGAERHRMPPPQARPPEAQSCPRATALKSAAETEQAFYSFINAVLPWFVDASMLAAVSAHELTQLASLESWLEKAGMHADPSRIRTDMASGSQSEAMLVNYAFKLAGIIKSQSAAPSSSSAAAPAGLVTHQVIQPDRDGTEMERAERTGLAQKAAVVMGSSVLQSKLLELAQTAATQGGEDELFDKVTADEMRSTELYPLLNTGEDITKAIAGHLSPPMLMQVIAVRGTLARRIEKGYVYCEAGVTPPQRVRSALHQIRIGRMSKLKMLHLLDKDDAATIEDPLKQLAILDATQSDAIYAQAINALTHAWQLCTPADAAAVMRFCGRLGSFTASQRQLGATWESLSKFHSAVFKKVDEEAVKYALAESRISRASPRIEWIDTPSKYHLALNAAVSEQTSITAAEKAVAKLSEELLKSMKAQLPKPPKQNDRADDTEKPPKKKKAKRPRKTDDAARKPGANPQPSAADKETPEQRRLRVAKEMLAKHGEKDGKPPCYFHFRDTGDCRFPAAQCNNGHHGDDP
jgi:hypothetical protein